MENKNQSPAWDPFPQTPPPAGSADVKTNRFRYGNRVGSLPIRQRRRSVGVHSKAGKNQRADAIEALGIMKEKTQKEKFEEAARELGTDQSDEAFEAAVNKIAHAPKLTNEQIKELARRKRDKAKG
ncbi:MULTISPECIES: hypothetical protein [unclassified Mesorhizobium]|uniref:hypothetical protein n=1 Tax=unclassified Mesorhizobium TaxID=325217 RepID=UPI00112DA1A5|nr:MULTISPECIES: hypothetical protein [unclassified Mesorhizobium]TPI57677.1 hypothetical protein FJ417_21485 [Mesorhizobium sp. B3-1-7]TPJ36983.1 hypothetical protein FJ418_01505 [Mesorhizobium sp. B2-8-3]UCI28218.1 hypothetical protein FJ430_11720 [Mesorhizobium sp. B2-8-5]